MDKATLDVTPEVVRGGNTADRLMSFLGFMFVFSIANLFVAFTIAVEPGQQPHCVTRSGVAVSCSDTAENPSICPSDDLAGLCHESGELMIGFHERPLALTNGPIFLGSILLLTTVSGVFAWKLTAPNTARGRLVGGYVSVLIATFFFGALAFL